MNAPAVTIVHGIPGNSAHGFASIQSQLVNAIGIQSFNKKNNESFTQIGSHPSNGGSLQRVSYA